MQDWACFPLERQYMCNYPLWFKFNLWIPLVCVGEASIQTKATPGAKNVFKRKSTYSLCFKSFVFLSWEQNTYVKAFFCHVTSLTDILWMPANHLWYELKTKACSRMLFKVVCIVWTGCICLDCLFVPKKIHIQCDLHKTVQLKNIFHISFCYKQQLWQW